jgi:WD40 repeat protein
MLAIGTSDG